MENGEWKTLQLASRGDSYMTNASVLKECLKEVLPHISKLVWNLDRPSAEDPHIQAILEALLQQQRTHPLSIDWTLTLALEKSLLCGSVVLPLITDTALLDSLKLSLNFARPAIQDPMVCRQFQGHGPSIWQAASTRLKSLHLERFDFQMSNEGCPLTELIRSTTQSNTTLKQLQLTQVRSVCLPVGRAVHNPWHRSQLTHLSLHNCHLPIQSLLQNHILHMPCLTHLELVFDPPIEHHNRDEEDFQRTYIESLNVTAELVALLQRGRLQALTVDGPEVDVEPMLDVLTTANPLAKYHVLSSLQTPAQQKAFAQLFPANVTLTDVLLPEPNNNAVLSTIAYQVALNRWGRARLNGLQLTMSQLVELLAPINDDTVPAFQIQYEFLRRVPGMWSGSS